jgi:hypothetical protein
LKDFEEKRNEFILYFVRNRIGSMFKFKRNCEYRIERIFR